MKNFILLTGITVALHLVSASGFDFDFSNLMKPGQCPVHEAPPECPSSKQFECIVDLDCPETQKCCDFGCDTLCINKDGTVPSESTERDVCPAVKEDSQCSPKSHDQCRWDKECFSHQKCCFDGCIFKCVGEPVPSNPVCNEAIDIGLLMDTSGSISKKDFNIGKEFIRTLLSFFSIGNTAVHVSITTIGDEPETILSFSQGASENVILSAVDSIPYEQGNSKLGLSLFEVGKVAFQTSGGMRKNVPKALVVLSDGMSTNGMTGIHMASTKLKSKGVRVYSIGLTRDVDIMTILEIATSEEAVFAATHYEQMLNAAKDVAGMICLQAGDSTEA